MTSSATLGVVLGRADQHPIAGSVSFTQYQDQDQSLVTKMILVLAHDKEESMLSPVQVIIGRGRGGFRPPLSAAAWGRFQTKIAHFMTVRGEFYRTVEGLGIDTNGAPEQNLTLLGSVDDDYLKTFRDFLNHLRVEFEQDVILLVVGDLDVIV